MVNKKNLNQPRNYINPYPSSPQQVTGPKLSLSMDMGVKGGSGGEPYLGMLQTMMPPIANTAEAVMSTAPTRERRELSDDVLGEIRFFIQGENPTKPYTDLEVYNYLTNLGYEVSRQDVALVRNKLGIKPSSRRYQ